MLADPATAGCLVTALGRPLLLVCPGNRGHLCATDDANDHARAQDRLAPASLSNTSTVAAELSPQCLLPATPQLPDTGLTAAACKPIASVGVIDIYQYRHARRMVWAGLIDNFAPIVGCFGISVTALCVPGSVGFMGVVAVFWMMM
eukprot:m.8831 g.8831  ORF g.8831 m.8831 type:complete len:146 (-) comp2336_c0_seq2:74-511(-)